MDKILVAFFSASGNTAEVAGRLADILGADRYEIRPKQPYSKYDLDWRDRNSRSSLEMNNRSYRPEIIVDLEGLEEYDTVFVGFPIWWYREPSGIDTFMEAYDFSGKTVIPFCTSGGSGIGASAQNIQALAKEAKVMEGTRFAPGASDAKLSKWVGTLK